LACSLPLLYQLSIHIYCSWIHNVEPVVAKAFPNLLKKRVSHSLAAKVLATNINTHQNSQSSPSGNPNPKVVESN
jgi:hypothetical protein